MVKLCKVKIKSQFLSGTCFYNDVKEAMESLMCDLDPFEFEDKIKIEVSMVEMTNEEFEALPEFDGF